jgi:hypothetical protein
MKLALARAVLLKADILLLDEPTVCAFASGCGDLGALGPARMRAVSSN